MNTVINRYRRSRARSRAATRRELLLRSHARATAGPAPDPHARVLTLAGSSLT